MGIEEKSGRQAGCHITLGGVYEINPAPVIVLLGLSINLFWIEEGLKE